MSFDDDERSVQDSRPVELYTVTFGADVFRRTTYHRDLVVSGQTYLALPVRRGLDQVSGGMDVVEHSLELPINDAIIPRYAGLGVVPQKVDVTCTRLQLRSGTTRQMWTGRVSYLTFRGKTAVFKIAQMNDDPLAVEIPNAIVSRHCNNVFGDTICQVDKSANAVLTSLTADPSGLFLNVASVGGYPDGSFNFGELIHIDSGNERRTIVSQVGTLVEIDVVLPNTAGSGDSVRIIRGCDKSIDTCRVKYANQINFIGMPHIDSSNFFLVDLRLVRAS
jgi:uncharacterized phage protein (TIGR02218 family)